MENVENIIIIGGGPAGYTAAIYAAREDFNPLVISGIQAGGQLMLTSEVENYPGFPDGVHRPRAHGHVQEAGREIRRQIHRRQRNRSGPYQKSIQNSRRRKGAFWANCVIIAIGASAKWMGIDSEQKFIGKGVSSCATCDAPFYKNKDVVVVGGGDTAMEDSLFLTKFVKSVTIVHRRDEFRASKIMQEQVHVKPEDKSHATTPLWMRLLGQEKVDGVKLKNLETDETTSMDIDGVFVAIGHTPNTSFLKGKLKLDENGYIITRDEVKTDIEGVFVAGDVVDRVYRQAVTAAGSGAKAAIEARNYLQGTGSQYHSD